MQSGQGSSGCAPAPETQGAHGRRAGDADLGGSHGLQTGIIQWTQTLRQAKTCLGGIHLFKLNIAFLGGLK